MTRIVYVGDTALRTKCAPVTEFNDELKLIVDDMVKTMCAVNGMGLAANQIGISKSIYVIQVDKSSRLLTIINPKILNMEEEIAYDEGCLSIPGVSARVKRFNKVQVEYQDENGINRVDDLTGSEAVAMQHEMDHLDGKLYIDRISGGDRALLLKKHRQFLQQSMKRFR